MNDKLVIAAYEFLGTLILVSTIVFVVATGTDASAIVLGLYCAILIGGHVSGAHFNPAITLATVIGRRHFDKLDMALLFYWIPQFIGAIVGFLIPKFLVSDFIADDVGIALMPYVDANGDSYDLSAFVVEIWATFIFSMVFLCVTHSSTHHSKIGAVNGILVCVGLWVGINIAGRASGGGLNPAVGLSLNVCSKLFYSNDDSLGKVWIYLLGPWIGSILSGAFYAFLHHPVCQPLTCGDEHEDVMEEVIEPEIPTHGHHIPELGTGH